MGSGHSGPVDGVASGITSDRTDGSPRWVVPVTTRCPAGPRCRRWCVRRSPCCLADRLPGLLVAGLDIDVEVVGDGDVLPELHGQDRATTARLECVDEAGTGRHEQPVTGRHRPAHRRIGYSTCPASAPKPSRPGPGRPPGRPNTHPAPRHDVHIVSTVTSTKTDTKRSKTKKSSNPRPRRTG